LLWTLESWGSKTWRWEHWDFIGLIWFW
jgi:hypothetical protein